ncbi:Ger(x)C family spore germination protein [Cohnella zeiphila]|uniref:Ger(x)C family spore germination protein n=1 Tax=Cohnella zeiphila TaxID=2761120 RepID=UPI001EE33791|nr:Ger(x)C family spore germination protein [Cohnella zeiphila]
MIKRILRFALLTALLPTAGCWDRTEVNDLALDMGTLFDLTEKGDLKATIQIALPRQAGMMNGGGQNKKFFVLSETGKNHIELQQLLQDHLSRRLFTSHRSVIFISERLARKGLEDFLDAFTHDPHNRLRTFIIVVQDPHPDRIVQIRYPFEEAPTEGVREAEILGDQLATTMRDFFISASSEGLSPVTAAIRSDASSEKNAEAETFRLSGSAVFKGLKLAGFLNEKETNGLLWISGKMKHSRISAPLPKGKGIVGMILVSAERHIDSEVRGQKVKFNIRLTGNGDLFENNSPLDITGKRNLQLAQHALEDEVERQVRNCLNKLQKQYRSDVAGFSSVLYQNHPHQWRRIKEQWDDLFPEADIAVSVKLNLRHSGVTGQPLQLKEKEIEK